MSTPQSKRALRRKEIEKARQRRQFEFLNNNTEFITNAVLTDIWLKNRDTPFGMFVGKFNLHKWEGTPLALSYMQNLKFSIWTTNINKVESIHYRCQIDDSEGNLVLYLERDNLLDTLKELFERLPNKEFEAIQPDYEVDSILHEIDKEVIEEALGECNALLIGLVENELNMDFIDSILKLFLRVNANLVIDYENVWRSYKDRFEPFDDAIAKLYHWDNEEEIPGGLEYRPCVINFIEKVRDLYLCMLGKEF